MVSLFVTNLSSMASHNVLLYVSLVQKLCKFDRLPWTASTI